MLKTNQVPFQKGYDENIAKYKYISKIIKKGHTEGNLGFISVLQDCVGSLNKALEQRMDSTLLDGR